MAAIHIIFMLSLEHAQTNDVEMFSLKIDKSKGFDCVILQRAGTMMLAYGVPNRASNYLP